MECIQIKGFSGGNLFYVPDEKHLFMQKSRSSKKLKKYLVCYDTVLSKNKVGGGADSEFDDENFKEVICNGCPARCTFDEKTGLVIRNFSPHTNHVDHEIKFRDLQTLNAMKDHCRYLATNFPFSARRIPIRDIYMTEMAK